MAQGNGYQFPTAPASQGNRKGYGNNGQEQTREPWSPERTAAAVHSRLASIADEIRTRQNRKVEEGSEPPIFDAPKIAGLELERKMLREAAVAAKLIEPPAPTQAEVIAGLVAAGILTAKQAEEAIKKLAPAAAPSGGETFNP